MRAALRIRRDKIDVIVVKRGRWIALEAKISVLRSESLYFLQDQKLQLLLHFLRPGLVCFKQLISKSAEVD